MTAIPITALRPSRRRSSDHSEPSSPGTTSVPGAIWLASIPLDTPFVLHGGCDRMRLSGARTTAAARGATLIEHADGGHVSYAELPAA